MCFDMRFERTALYAAENGFQCDQQFTGHFTRWKNMQQVTGCGRPLLPHYPNLWCTGIKLAKLRFGSSRMIEISKARKILSREYWLCVFSMRYQSHRKSQGALLSKLALHYGKPED